MPGINHYADAESKIAQLLQTQGGDPGADTLTPEQQEAAFQQGAAQAEQDAAAAGADAPNQPTPDQPAAPDPAAPAAPTVPAPDPNAAILAQFGFADVGEMAAKYQENSQALTDAFSQLDKLAAIKKAMGNEDELDPQDPLYANKKAMREELGPLYDDMRANIRNRKVTDAWNKDAASLADFGEFQDKVSEFIMAHPELAIDEGGLKTAYHTVRSSEYKSPSKLLEDPEFQKQAAANPAISEAVIKAYLTKIAASGENLPRPIDGSGSVPLTGEKKPYKNLNEAFDAVKKQYGR